MHAKFTMEKCTHEYPSICLKPIPYRTSEAELVLMVHVKEFFRCGNDPSAGSPTETLLRLHLPLNDKVKITSRGRRPREEAFDHDPRVSPDHSIGRCDGRCVQRAGT